MEVSVIIKGQLKLSGVKLGSGTRFNIRNPRISGADLRILRRGGAGQEFLGGGGGQDPQKGNSVGIFIKTSIPSMHPLHPSLDLIRDLGSD